MPLITLAAAKAHLREESSYPDEQVEPYLRAAELSAAQFLNRKVYADQDELNSAVGAIPAILAAATAARKAAIEAADAIEDPAEREEAKEHAVNVFLAAVNESREARRGMVITPDVKAAILLILGHLYENRQDVQAGLSAVAIPMGSLHLLQPYRVGMGA